MSSVAFLAVNGGDLFSRLEGAQGVDLLIDGLGRVRVVCGSALIRAQGLDAPAAAMLDIEVPAPDFAADFAVDCAPDCADTRADAPAGDGGDGVASPTAANDDRCGDHATTVVANTGEDGARDFFEAG